MRTEFEKRIIRQRKSRSRGPNGPEMRCEIHLEESFRYVTKRGWPDFVAISNGRMVAVEVKPTMRHSLKRDQVIVMAHLSRAGIPCYVYRPGHGYFVVNRQGEETGEIHDSVG